jgi:hypothetical protein
MNRWQLDLEISLLKEQGFSEQEINMILENGNEQGIIKSNKENDTRTGVRQVA